MRIRTQIGIAVASFLVIMLIIMYSMYAQTTNIVVKNNNRFTADIMNTFQQKISQSYDEMNQMMVSLAFDPAIQKFMMLDDPVNSYAMIKDLDRKMISLKAGRKGVEDIVIIGSRGAEYSLNGGIDTIKKHGLDIVKSNEVYVSNLQVIPFNKLNIDGFFFAQQVFLNDKNDGMMGSTIGYIAVIVNVESLYFSQDQQQPASGIEFHLIDRSGNVFPNTYAQDVSQILHDWMREPKQRNKTMYTVGEVRGSVLVKDAAPIHAKILALIPDETLLQELSVIRLRSMMMVFGALLLMVIPFIVIVDGVIQPMQKLVKFMKSIKRGNLNNLESKLELSGSIEINMVAEELNAMLTEINSLTNQLLMTTTNLLASEIEKEKAASAFLRSQINPHFLNNTLESIRSIALEEGSDRIVAMIKALGKLFHYSIKGAGLVTLEQELNAVKSYIFLQLVRFEERFEVEYDIEDHALRVTVMKMILQPLVENAIFHGLEPKLHPGKLKISGKIEMNQILVIIIEDNGVGVSAERVRYIQEKLSLSMPKMSQEGRYTTDVESIGLFNVNNRIRLAYGDEYGLSFDSSEEVGTRIHLSMPIDHILP